MTRGAEPVAVTVFKPDGRGRIIGYPDEKITEISDTTEGLNIVDNRERKDGSCGVSLALQSVVSDLRGSEDS